MGRARGRPVGRGRHHRERILSVTSAREAALRVLRATGRGRRLDLAMAAEAGGLPDRERRWLHEVTYGTVRLRGRLDHLLAHHLHGGLDAVAPALLDVLRLGAYQLLYMGSVPEYAAVSQSVDQARRVEGEGAAGLANGVLRSVARAGEDAALFPDFDEDPAGWLSTWGSHPRWMVERWLERWSAAAVRVLVEANNRIPPVTLVPLDGDVDDGVRRLAEAGIGARAAGEGTGAVELVSGADPAAALRHVRAVVQDPAAALTAQYATPEPGSRIADLCAAPGGKALALAGRGFEVLALDRSRPRMELLVENARRTGLRVQAGVALAEAPPITSADMVLVDAPCTGTGTLRRHPDARWRLGPDDVESLARVQARILAGAAKVVASGGLLVYGTCTLEPEENEEQVRRFLARHDDFEPAAPGPVDERYLDGQGRLAVLPWKTGFDGAFAARLRKVR